MFLLVAANIDYGVSDFLLNIGLVCFGLLCLLEERPRLTLNAAALVLIAAAGALAKFSALITAALTIGAVAMDWFLRKRQLKSLALATGWTLAVLSGWMALGQNLSHLPTYLGRGFELSGGYEQAMGLEASWLISICGFLLATFVLQLVFLGSSRTCEIGQKQSRGGRLLITAWLLAFLFITWKHGFVRADTHHVVYFAGFVSILAPLLAVLNRSEVGRNTGQNALALATCMLGLLTLQFSLDPQFLDVGKPFLHLTRNLQALVTPDQYFNQMNGALKAQRVSARLPRLLQTVGTKPMDIFGNKQAFAALNGLNLQPRPVFQSYAAYNEPLMHLNEEHYLSDAAPQFVLFRLEPIDERLPALEDARLLRLLLFRYDFAGSDGPFLLLQAQKQAARGARESSGKSVSSELTRLQEGTLRAGERLNLARFGSTNLWLELKLEPTLAGRLRQVLYRPAELALVVWGDGSQVGPRRFRAPVPMLSAGFVASPLLLKTDDFANACRGCGSPRPTAYAVAFSKGDERWWRTEIHFRIFQMESRPSEATIVLCGN
jgi:hypothetical protein